MSKLQRIALCAIVVVLPAVYAGTVAAKTRHTKSVTKTFVLKSGATKAFNVGYPLALKYGNAKYSGKVVIQPKSSKVKVLSKGSAVGGSVFRVKVRNGNASSVHPVSVRITATTTWYS
jgi:hypothetical protein